MIKLIKLLLFVSFVTGFFFSSAATPYTVAKDGSGQYSTIMAAINAAGPGDVVQILDVATYPEQVTIDSTKYGLTLTSKNPTDISKPRIVWQDTMNVGPRTYTESLIDSLITFYKNGAIQLISAKDITIEGISIDGGTPFYFGGNNIWNNKNPMFHGNSCIAVSQSGRIHIRNCTVSNAYFGIYIYDQNQGGIFGNPNPADLEPWKVVPLSGYGKSGNHIIEYNRIHNNSYGMFFESAWDLGSTIRYNLLYENHHYSDTFAKEVKAKTSEGANQPGGAIMFKDVMLSPLAVYNNTFWHNFLELIGHWKAGYHHLVFNNIFGPPYRYLQDETVMSGTYMDICKCLPNRMNNCVFAAHVQAPDPNYVAIFNSMNPQAVNNQILPGALIAIAPAPSYPASAEVRWLETPFISTNEASTTFLTPNWSDTLVQRYIIDNGWAASGVRDPDGSPADLGAIPQGGGMPVDLAIIIPTAPVRITGDTATVTFTLTPRIGNIAAPTMKLHRWIANLPYPANANSDCWSSNWAAGIIPAVNVTNIPEPATPLKVGTNTYSFALSVAQTTDFSFLELIIEGIGSDSKPYTTCGFLPYRKMPGGKFIVEILDPVTDQVKTQVQAGDTVNLKIIALTNNNIPVPDTVRPVAINLISGFPLSGVTGTPFSLPAGVPPGGSISPVVFTRSPAGGYEYVQASGMWTSGTNQPIALLGISGSIRIRSGTAQTVQFLNPPSIRSQTAPPSIEPGIPFPGQITVFDRFGNRVSQPTTVYLTSLNPAIGAVSSATDTITTDSTGMGRFSIEVTGGNQGEIFQIRAELPGKQPDTAWLKVGTVSAINKPSSAGLANRNLKEFSVTIFDLRGRLVYSQVIKSSTPMLRPEKQLSQFKRSITPAVYLVQISEKGPRSSKSNHRVFKLMLR
jgi:parallel beta-helix repeat protein